jgi:hypothetical protein
MVTFSVTNTNDIGIGSLRQAIREANALTGKDTINFDGVFADSIADIITLGGSSLNITDDLTIEGIGADLLTVSSNNTSRVFEIHNSANVDIIGLTIANGYDRSFDTGGGGILNEGTLNVIDSIIKDNDGGYLGGGISNFGTLTVSNSSINNNTSSFTGGAIFNTGTLILNNTTIGNSYSGQGAGIYNSGNATVSSSTISENYASVEGGGIYNTGTLRLSYSNINNNKTDEYRNAGGISNSGNLIVTDSIISSNIGGVYRYSGTGGIYNSGNAVVSNSTISNNRADIGGGIYNDGTFTLNNTTVDGNLTEVAAGIFNAGTLTVNNSTISNNGSYSSGTQDGGGILNAATLTINNSTINNNSALNGSGISNSGIATVINSTISSNDAYYGGGFYNNGILAVVNSTILKNSSNLGEGGGIYNTQEGTATIKNSIIAGNFDNPSNSSANATSSDVAGSFITNGFNLIGNLSGSTGFNSSEQLNVPLTDVLDTILRDNGGATKTHALVVGSPAINAGLNADILADTTDLDGDGNTTEPIPYDQRGSGFARISGSRVDIGAYEAVVNVINGTPIRDIINGTADNDIITGFKGRDVLTGSNGADSFVYTTITDLGDTITDFQSGADKIVLRQLFQSFNLSNLNYTNAISGGYLQFETVGKDTVILIDPDGSAGKDRAIKFITANDISVVALNKSINFAF